MGNYFARFNSPLFRWTLNRLLLRAVFHSTIQPVQLTRKWVPDTEYGQRDQGHMVKLELPSLPELFITSFLSFKRKTQVFCVNFLLAWYRPLPT
jgi:hypothetical protein